MEITTVHPKFVPVKQATLNVTVLARKILPPIFGIATVGWIIGGTIWFDNQSRLVSANSLSNTSTVNRSAVFLQTTTPPRAACCDSTHFQALNLFFKKDKFRFAENEELRTYFKDLNAALCILQEERTKLIVKSDGIFMENTAQQVHIAHLNEEIRTLYASIERLESDNQEVVKEYKLLESLTRARTS